MNMYVCFNGKMIKCSMLCLCLNGIKGKVFHAELAMENSLMENAEIKCHNDRMLKYTL